MIFRVARQLREAGVLGMNRRNADFIMTSNPRSLFPRVDDKVLTKKLAGGHQIPTPLSYLVIERQGDISSLEEKLEEQKQFAVKPARGAGGSGIILIMDRQGKSFITQSGEILSWADFVQHLSDILSGIYSLSGLEDRAILEALIHPDPVFAAVTYQGVPDVRIVVYRGIPVMSMVRLPTRASDGKANLHRGAIGAGIEIHSGVTITAVHRSQVVTHHPDTGNPVSGIRVPYWDRMLLMAAMTLEMTGLGYIGVDLIIDRERGPLLLELNARPGLAIQMANRSGLLKRLERVEKAPAAIFASPESRVAWAKEAFQGAEA
jgi:alpha-L-glutamate ligase-like protein